MTIDGKRATGVSYRLKSGAEIKAAARREVILAAGALATPTVLMRDRASAPRRISSSMELRSRSTSRKWAPTSRITSRYRCLDSGRAGERFGPGRGPQGPHEFPVRYFFRTGLVTSNVVEAGGFFDLDGDGRCDMQIAFLPIMRGELNEPMPSVHGLTVQACQIRPKSRGEVRLKSADPAAPPLFKGNYLSDPEDVAQPGPRYPLCAADLESALAGASADR